MCAVHQDSERRLRWTHACGAGSRDARTPPDDGELEVIETAGMIGLIVFSDLVFRFAEEHAS